MAITPRRFHNTMLNLLENNFKESLVSAQLLSGQYTYDATHSTIADMEAFKVGDPVELTSKTITVDQTDFRTLLDFDDIVYTDQGVLNARYVVYHFGPGLTTDKLIAIVDLDDTAQEQEITPALKISVSGFLSIPFV